MPLCRILAALPFAAFLAPSAAIAAGLWNFDQGASNYARGGANIAATSDPTAVYLNPAALAGQSGFAFMGMADAISDSRSFERAPDRLGGPRFCCRKTEYDPVANEQPVFPPSPGVYMAGNLAKFGVPQLTLAAAIYGPPRSDTVFPAGGPQRYSQVEAHSLQIHTAIAAGYQLPWRKTRVGLTLMMIEQVVDTGLALNSFFGESEERGWDANVDVIARDEMIPNAIVGASTEAITNVTVAASYQHSYDVKAKGDATGSVGPDLDELAFFRPGKLGVEVKMPAIARGAVRFDAPSRRWNAEGAFVYENWSRNDEVLFSPKQPGGIALILDDESLRFPVNDIVLPTHYRDTWSLRFGGEYVAVPEAVTIRSGIFYERAAIAPEWLTVGNFDLDKIGVSAGGRFDFRKRGWVELCAGYQHWLPVEVKNSRVRIIDPLSTEEKWALGNGKYTSSRIQVMAAAGVRFGAGS